jgi:putative spermidine/putrescine transport system substrate-binding protein
VSGRRDPTLTRRALFAKGGAAAGAVALGAAAPGRALAGPGVRGSFTETLHILGCGVAEFPPIKQQAEKDLGFTIAFEVTDPDSCVEKAITQPASFDVMSYYHFGYDLVWPRGSLRPIDTRRIARWPQVSDLFKRGKLRPHDPRCTYGDGDAPFRSMYVADSGRYLSAPDKPAGPWRIVEWIDEGTGRPHHGLPEPRYVNGIPTIFNADSIGYNSRVIDRPPERVSWAELVNARWKGRVALFSGAQVALLDTAMAAEGAGLMRFKNKGNMTRAEIDRLVKILIRLKKQGQFHRFWVLPDEPIEFMRSEEVVVEAMWTYHVIGLQRQGFPVKYASPPEGFRGWSGALAISSAITDPDRLQAAYDYINWWQDGWAGAFMMRLGYYSAVQSTSRGFADPAEWDYWIAGKPAAKHLRGAFGDATIRKGAVRDGGSFAKRACRFACWNSVFRQRAYEERRWRAFVTA